MALHVTQEIAKLLTSGVGGDSTALDNALEDLEASDARKSRMVELRFFDGLSLEEIAETLDISVTNAEREWRSARDWLHRTIMPEHRDGF